MKKSQLKQMIREVMREFSQTSDRGEEVKSMIGKTIKGIDADDNVMILTFNDGSTARIDASTQGLGYVYTP
jgi:hypothetical protein